MAYGDFQDLYTDVHNRIAVSSSISAELTKVKRLINQGLRDWATKRPWTVLQRRHELRLFAPYSTGTVDVTQGSTTWTGTSTAWNTNSAFGEANVQATFKIQKNGDSEIYEVSSVTNDTTIVSLTKYTQSTATGASYEAWQNEYALQSDFDRPVDIRQMFDDITCRPLGLREFRSRYAASTAQGKPRYYTLGRNRSGLLRIFFWPIPDKAIMMPYDYITSNLAQSSGGTDQAELSADGDVALIPEKYRHMLVHYAVAQWYRDYKDDARFQSAMGEYAGLVQRMANDVEPTDDLPRLEFDNSKYAYYPRPSAAIFDLGDWFDREG